MGANISGNFNIALGNAAANEIETGSYNIAIGVDAMLRNKAGNSNLAIGRDSLKNNTSSGNMAIGEGSLLGNTSGTGNVGLGNSSIRTNTTGFDNTAVGNLAGNGTTGAISENVMLGNKTGYALTTGGNRNVLIGSMTGQTITTGNSNILIGYNVQAAAATDSAKLNIGNAIYGNLTSKSIGIGVAVPTATLHLKAGTATEAPLKLSTGVLTSTPNVGAIEFDGTSLYYTNSSGTRKTLAVVA
jgi:hypothetical protein